MIKLNYDFSADKDVWKPMTNKHMIIIRLIALTQEQRLTAKLPNIIVNAPINDHPSSSSPAPFTLLPKLYFQQTERE
jgi:hypothetical protein